MPLRPKDLIPRQIIKMEGENLSTKLFSDLNMKTLACMPTHMHTMMHTVTLIKKKIKDVGKYYSYNFSRAKGRQILLQTP